MYNSKQYIERRLSFLDRNDLFVFKDNGIVYKYLYSPDYNVFVYELLETGKIYYALSDIFVLKLR